MSKPGFFGNGRTSNFKSFMDGRRLSELLHGARIRGLEIRNLAHRLVAEYSFRMSTVSEIQAVLPQLTTQELQAVDAALREQFRSRKIGILYDDAYGLWTEEDQAATAAEAFALMDREERHREPS